MFRKLLPLAADWNNIGVLLGIQDHILQEIKHDYSQCRDRLRVMLSKWLKTNDPAPTWSSLAEAMEELDPEKAQEMRSCIAE